MGYAVKPEGHEVPKDEPFDEKDRVVAQSPNDPPPDPDAPEQPQPEEPSYT